MSEIKDPLLTILKNAENNRKSVPRQYLIDRAVEAFSKQLKAEKRASDLARDVRRSLVGLSTEEIAEWFRRTEEINQQQGG